jgi:chemotaxis protein methyltransferase CheR
MLGTETTLNDLIDLVASFAGLRLGARDEASFRQIVQRRMEALKVKSLQEYYALLAAAKNGLVTTGPELALQEWHLLLNQLTIGESYFFRDERQFSLLRQQLIPDLIAAKQAARGVKQLRVWSAGCATGEEVYSLAIMLREMGLAQDGWLLNVVGTDINQDFLAKAERGLYSPWSFRQTAAAVKQQYFLPERSDHWQIRPDLRRLTQFFEFNLAQDAVARLTAAGPFDLILCRNVFIYFTPAAIAATLAKFYAALTPGGYLITGHAELQGIPLGDFRVRSFPASVVYQRPAALPAAGKLAPTQAVLPSASRPSLRQSASRATRPVTPAPSPSKPDGAQSTYAAALAEAQTLANIGSYAAAQKACEAAIAACPFAVEPCYLLANIAEETGDIEGAKVFLKRAIYLDPNTLPAYLELADLYDRTQDSARAVKTRRHALSLLSQLPPTQLVISGLSASALCQQLQAKLQA